jgi:deazaflavin-dependent oxidoreductase (nitroreductase family)
VTTVKIKKINKGRYGLLATASIPKIAGAAGSVTSFSLVVDKKFTYKGKKVSVLSAKCPDGKRNVGWRVDPIPLRLTRGRLGTGLVIPTALLETTGARTGKLRRNGVIYFNDGDDLIVVASKAGAPEHPAWLHNARAHPEVSVNGQPFRAAELSDARELAGLWQRADRVFPPFDSYRRSASVAGRTIPMLRLTPIWAGSSS